MSVDVLGYLDQKGLPIRRASGEEVHTPCMFCAEDGGKRGRLYINTNPEADIPGLFHCKLCDARGSLVSIQKFYGDATEKQEREDDGYNRRLILATAANYYHEALGDNEEVLRWLKAERGLTYETITAHQLGFADGGLFKHLRQAQFRTEDIVATGLVTTERETGRMVDLLRQHVTIPYLVAGNVVMIRGRAYGGDDGRSKYITPTGQKTRLFNSDASWDAEELMVCEGEFDCLLLEQLGYQAVACPGANVWQDGWVDYFADARRVWIVFDREASDIGGKGATKVAEKIGAKAKIIELPPHDQGKAKNDVTEFLVVCGHSKADFDDLMKGFHGALISVDEAIAEHMELQGAVGLKFGIPVIDQLIEPGLLGSQVMVCLASTGTGKTIFLINLFQRICLAQPDFSILFVSLEQTRGEWWERARRIYRFFHPGATDHEVADFWRGRIWLDDRNRVTEEQLLSLLDDYQYEMGKKPDLVAIDYLGYWAQSYKGDRYERTADAIMSLKAIAKERRIRCITPHQVSRGTTHGTEPSINAARDSGVVEETADFVASLWMPDTVHGKAMGERSGEFKLRMGKSRHGGVGHVEEMVFAPLNLAICLRSEITPVEWARNESFYQSQYGENWEQALIRHEAGTGKDEAKFAVVERTWNKKRQGHLSVVK